MTRTERTKLIEFTKQARELTFQISDQFMKAQAAKRPQDVPSIEDVKELAAVLQSISLTIVNHLSNETTLVTT